MKQKILLFLASSLLILSLVSISSVAKASIIIGDGDDECYGDECPPVDQIDVCSNLKGIQEVIPVGYVRYKDTLCAKKYHSPAVSTVEPQVLAATTVIEAPVVKAETLPQGGAESGVTMSIIAALAGLFGSAGISEVIRKIKK